MAFNCGCSPPSPSADVDNRSVFCSGPLLDRVQNSNMFPNSKYFVDMSCIYSPAQTMADYELFSNCARNDGSLEFLQMFVEKHFNPPGSELELWTPTDWKAQPSFLNRICDPDIKQFAAEINELWKQLGRRVMDDVQENPDLYTIIHLPKPFILPDENCREYSYWGSFWIIRGLLQCGMHQTARGMIENFLALVQHYGHVPACGRIYCTDRTQPPLLIMMMKSYVEVTKDEQFAIQSLPILEAEFENFVSGRSIEVKGRTMYQYRAQSPLPGPRPDAYREDLAGAEKIMDEAAREKYYNELKSASESGQDFSSRWFVTSSGSNEALLSDTKPSAIVPVELNAIIFRSGKILAEFNRKAGNAKKAEEYQDRSCVLVKAIRDVLWNNQAGIWLDYDVENQQSRNYFCCTNFAPLWARAFPLIDTDKVSKAVMDYIRDNNLDGMPGGLPHTLNKKAGEKWDYPNVFSPMMFMVVEGLDNLGTRVSKAMARRWAHRWVKSNYEVFKAEGFMFEKYFCEEFGTSRESSPSVGYGWSNGVIIEFMCKYGREIRMSDEEDKCCQCKARKKRGSYLITSQASMELNEKGFPSTKSMDKKKMCEDLIRKTTAAIGTQSSAFHPESSKKLCTCRNPSQHDSQEQQHHACTCARTQMVPVESKKQLKKDSSCNCGAASRETSDESHHDPNCPCHSKNKRSKSPKQKPPKEKKQKEPEYTCLCAYTRVPCCQENPPKPPKEPKEPKPPKEAKPPKEPKEKKPKEPKEKKPKCPEVCPCPPERQGREPEPKQKDSDSSGECSSVPSKHETKSKQKDKKHKDSDSTCECASIHSKKEPKSKQKDKKHKDSDSGCSCASIPSKQEPKSKQKDKKHKDSDSTCECASIHSKKEPKSKQKEKKHKDSDSTCSCTSIPSKPEPKSKQKEKKHKDSDSTCSCTSIPSKQDPKPKQKEKKQKDSDSEPKSKQKDKKHKDSDSTCSCTSMPSKQEPKSKQKEKKQKDSNSTAELKSKKKEKKPKDSYSTCSCKSEEDGNQSDCFEEEQEKRRKPEKAQKINPKKKCEDKKNSEQKRQEQQANMVGHYAPLKDITDSADDCLAVKEMKEKNENKKKKCCNCCEEDDDDDDQDEDECEDEDEDDDESEDDCVENSPSKSSQQNEASNSCCCSDLERQHAGKHGKGAKGKGASQQSRLVDDCSCSDSGAQSKPARPPPQQNRAGNGAQVQEETKVFKLSDDGTDADDCSGAQGKGAQGKGAKGKRTQGKGASKQDRLGNNCCKCCGIPASAKGFKKAQYKPSCYDDPEPEKIAAEDTWCSAQASCIEAKKSHSKKAAKSASVICPHCGGICTDTPSSSKQIVNSSAGRISPQMPGWSNIGLQKGCNVTANTSERRIEHEHLCKCNDNQMENTGYTQQVPVQKYCGCDTETNPMGNNMEEPGSCFEADTAAPRSEITSNTESARRASPLSSTCGSTSETESIHGSDSGPCEDNEAQDFRPQTDNGPASMCNKQFPLKDLVSECETGPPKKKSERKKKCCKCDPDEEK